MSAQTQATNAQPLKPPVVAEETKEQRLRRLLAKARLYRESAVRDRGRVDGDPSKVYTWVNIREERQLFFQGMGWVLVQDKDSKIRSQHRQSDGTHKRADLILYEIDRDLFDAMEADQQLRALEQMEGASGSFEASAERLGAPVYRPRL